MSTLKTWAVALTTGEIVAIPARVRSEHERIDLYGHQAVLARMQRTRAYRAAKRRDPDCHARAILFPCGAWVTQF